MQPRCLGIHADRVLICVTWARFFSVITCLLLYCSSQDCTIVPLVSTVTGGYQDHSSSTRKTIEFMLAWPIVVCENILQWFVVPVRWPVPAISHGCQSSPRFVRTLLITALCLDVIEETDRRPSYHQTWAILAACLWPTLFLHAVWTRRWAGHALESSKVLITATVAAVGMWSTGAYLITFYPTMDGQSRPALGEYVAIAFRSTMLTAMSLVPVATRATDLPTITHELHSREAAPSGNSDAPPA